MTALRLTDRDRAAALAAIVIDTLNDRYSEGELENDPSLAELYNAASAVGDASEPHDSLEPAHKLRARHDNERHADELLTADVMGADEPSARGVLRAAILKRLR